MKKFLALFLAFCMIASSMVFVPMTIAAEDASSTIYVSASGNDENAGTESAPVATLGRAATLANSGDTIRVVGTVKLHTGETESGSKAWGSSNSKKLTVTGDTVDFTNIKHISLKEDFTFDNVTLTFTDGKYLFCWSNDITIKENVTVNGKVSVYCGAFQSSSGATNVTLLSGNYASIYGASHEAKYIIDGDTNVTLGGNVTADVVYGGSSVVNGDTHVTVGGSADVKTICGGGGTVNGNTYVVVKDNANPNSNPSNNSHNGGGYYIYGNGNGKVSGSTHVYFMDNAKSGYVVGGTSSASGSVGGTANVYMMGGTTYSVYGCGISVAADSNISANIIMTGGTAWQVFGGAETTSGESNTSFNGNITIKLLGGTVKRRVFGGSYNENDGSWKSSHSVSGTINLILGSNANVDFSSQESGILGSLKNDHALSAHSRRSSNNANEKAYIIYVDDASKSEFNGKLKLGQVSGGTTNDGKHLYKYTLEGNVITQTCSEHTSHSATATITPNGNTYTGEAIGVSVAYSDNWEFERFAVEHANNLNVGTATATLTIAGITTQTYNYPVYKATVNSPFVKPVNNTLSGLATDMEYSTDGKNYTTVTDVNMTFDSGKYYVRYVENDNHFASAATVVSIGNVISANSVSTIAGNTVEIIITLSGNTGIDKIDLTVNYNKEALTLESVSSGSVVNVNFDSENGKLTWNGNTTKKTGVLAKLTFTVNTDAEYGTYDITLYQDGFAIKNGSVNVAEFVHGDVVNNDGQIDSTDIVALRKAIANNAASGDLQKGADVNGDGEVSALDVLVLRQYIANFDFDAGESTITLGKE